MLRRVLVVVVVVALAPPVHADPAIVDDGGAKLSMKLEPDATAWQRSGFRLALGFVYGQLVGLRGAPSGRLIGGALRAGVRLGATWSIHASFQYGAASQRGGLSALRYTGTIDPTWHVTPRFSLAVGVGFGGIVESSTGRMQVDPLPSSLDTSYTFPDATTPLPSCSGDGVAGLARAEYAIVLGSRTSAVFAVEAIGQYVQCVDPTGRFDPDTGQAIVRRQYWPHTGVSLSVGLAWR